jgi:hypothetical protein
MRIARFLMSVPTLGFTGDSAVGFTMSFGS